MARSQNKSRRKASGARLRSARSKRQYELAGFAANTRLDERKIKVRRVIGANTKSKLLSEKTVNVATKGGKIEKTELVNVVENPANPNLVRRNILTKGAIVETKLGKVRITSRPGQSDTINAVLV